MVRDPHLRRFSGYMDRTGFDNQRAPVIAAENLAPGFGNSYANQDFGGIPFLPESSATPPRTATVGNHTAYDDDSQEDCDFSDAILRYINQILMEEDMEDKACMLQDSLDLQAAERSFYEVLGKTYPPSPNRHIDLPTDDGNCAGTSCLVDPPSCQSDSYSFQVQSSSVDGTPHSSYASSNGSNGIEAWPLDSPVSTLRIPDLNGKTGLASRFRKGAEEASIFLPRSEGLLDNLGVVGFPHREGNQWFLEAAVKVEKDEREILMTGSRGKKNPHGEDVDLEEGERSCKLAAVYPDSILRSKMFDTVLLCSGGKALSDLRESLQSEASKSVQRNPSKGSGKSGKGRGKKQCDKKEVVDLRTLLIHCAQAVAADDRRTAGDLLKQIRQHSSPFGDGNQRLAFCFADGLEARLAGTGSQIYKSLVSKRTSAADLLKAYHLYCAVCPFRKLSNFFSNRTIINAAVDLDAPTVHVIDFGILYGFQWPTLIQRLSDRSGGPPKLRITGIDFPQPGFRPAERIEETGRRLANYAESFHVPFEYNAIAKKWDAISVEELRIERGELLIVNCLYRFKNLHDESVSVDSARTSVLNLIREISPDIFIHGIVNGAFSAPFFVTRFREALFHFSALFDMLETNVPREVWERILIEKEILGREALNVIACEGWERVERPETYKQWRIRNLRAGLVQLPLSKAIVQRSRERVRMEYHKDFVIDQDSQWMLHGWKGRIVYALSCWKPA